MRFLADECCDKGVVRALRANGYDVLSVSDISPRAGDVDVIRLAVHEKRILRKVFRDVREIVKFSYSLPELVAHPGSRAYSPLKG